MERYISIITHRRQPRLFSPNTEKCMYIRIYYSTRPFLLQGEDQKFGSPICFKFYTSVGNHEHNSMLEKAKCTSRENPFHIYHIYFYLKYYYILFIATFTIL